MLDRYRDDPRVTPTPDGKVQIATDADGVWVAVHCFLGWVPTRTGDLDEPVAGPVTDEQNGRMFIAADAHGSGLVANGRHLEVGYDRLDDLVGALLYGVTPARQAA